MSESSPAQTPDRQARLEELLAGYLHSLEKGQPLDRSALLAANPDLADDLQSFFGNRDAMHRLAEPLRAAAEAPTITGPSEIRGAGTGTTVRYFGDYELLSEIARGGMGVVFKARQVNLNRIVALKMILAGQLANDSDVKRFYAEAEAAAKLDHPGIVPIFEIGQHEGQHYFSMAFVEGESLAKKVAEGPLPPREAAQMVKTVAASVEYAHQKGIIHRDLKPANVLLDGQGQPKVTDFGLAKQLKGDSGLTGTGQILGTPSYMPPEQAAGKLDEIGRRSDVYSLGAILYCLLTGRPPFQAASPIDTLMQVLEQEPVSVRLLNAQVPIDLETIALKCLEKDCSRRYGSAQELADELQRFLEDRPILARPVGTVDRMWRWCRRNRLVATLVSAVALLLLGSAIGGFWLAHGERLAKKAAKELADEKGKLAEEKGLLADKNQALFESERDAKEKARLAQTLADERKTAAEANATLAEQRREEADKSARLARKRLYVTHMNLVQTAWEDTRMSTVLDLLDRHRPMNDDDDLRNFEWYYWNRLCHRDQLTFKGHLGGVNAVAFSRDGTQVASASSDETVKIWNARTGQATHTLRGILGGRVVSVAFSPDGARVASGGNARIKVWNAITGNQSFELKGSMDKSVAFSPDGTRLATASWGREVKLWNATTGEEIATFRGHTREVTSVVFNPDGTKLASASEDQTIKLWDATTGNNAARTLSGHTGNVTSVAFSPDGTRIASASADQTLKFWDAITGEELATLRGHTGPVTSVAFSPDGTRLASGGADKSVKLWDAITGSELRTIKGHSGSVNGVAFSPDGSRVVSASADATLKLWNADIGPEVLTLNGHSSSVNDIAFSRDSMRLVSAGRDARIVLWDVSTGQPVRTLDGRPDPIFGVAYSPDGAWIVSGSQLEHKVKLWNTATGQVLRTFDGHELPVKSVAFSPDGKRIASASLDQKVMVWDANSGDSQLTLTGQADIGPTVETVMRVAFSPDGRLIALAGGGRTAIVWDAASGQETWLLKGHSGGVNRVAFSPDGTRIVTASSDGSLKLWDAATGKERHTLKGHAAAVLSVAFSPDGLRIVSGSVDETLKLWDTELGEETLTLKGHAGTIASAAFSPGGTRIASGSSDHTVRIWDAPRVVTTEQFNAVTKEQLLAKVPKSFSFELDQKHSDPQRGTRVWTRVDDKIFVERYPSGTENKLKILGRTTVAEIDGTILEKVGFEKVQVFIPDRASKTMEIKYRFVERPDEWVLLGTMEKVE